MVVVGSRARVADEIEIIVQVVAVLMGMTVRRNHLGLSRMLYRSVHGRCAVHVEEHGDPAAKAADGVSSLWRLRSIMGALITVVAKSNKNRSVDLSLPGDMRTGMTEHKHKSHPEFVKRLKRS
ncbi:hypothetical protein CN173_28525 [Sinorhizobium meliloti]|nr:hypothetical protein CN173_28525 [Sinorhizobium meliloti]